MKEPNEMYDRAVAIAEENGFKAVARFVYYSEHSDSAFGLMIQPAINHGVSIQVRNAYEPSDRSEPIILSPLDRAFLEPIIKAFAFADLTVIKALKDE